MLKQKKFSERYYSAIKSRLNLQTIGETILNGNDNYSEYSSFEERERNAFQELEKYLQNKYNIKEANMIIEEMMSYCNTVQSIYFSLGMKCGASLLIKLTDNFETDV